MADVYVNSWTEFVSAVAVSGDTVYLPEEAEWDMEEILPWGTQSALTFACTEINGRGTTIKNLHLNQAITVSKNNIIIRNLIMKDWLCEGGSNDDEKAVFTGLKNIYFYSCAFSGILASVKKRLVYGYPRCHNCSINIEASGAWFELAKSSNSIMRYCRVELHLPNSTAQVESAVGLDNEFCEIIIYAPNATGSFFSCYYKGCTVRGNMQGITSDGSWGGDWTGFVSVYLDGIFGEGYSARKKAGFVKCSQEQMKDPEYLRGKGFPIVVIEDGEE